MANKTLLKNLKSVLIGEPSAPPLTEPFLSKVGLVTSAGVTISESEKKVEDFVDLGNSFPTLFNESFNAVSFIFQIMLSSADAISLVRGGSVSETTWSFEQSSVYCSVKLLSPSGAYIDIPKALLLSKFSGVLADTGQILLDVRVIPTLLIISSIEYPLFNIFYPAE